MKLSTECSSKTKSATVAVIFAAAASLRAAVKRDAAETFNELLAASPIRLEKRTLWCTLKFQRCS